MINGQFIGVKETSSVFTIEHSFYVEMQGEAVLRATALGLYFATINGKRVSDAYLTPGWTSYNKMLQMQEYDITDLIVKGENTIAFTISEGWYCGPLFIKRQRNTYGSKTAVCADLLINGSCILSTDESWKAKESYIRESGIYDGEIQDFLAQCSPLTVCEIPFDKTVIIPQISEPVRTTERIRVKQKFRTLKGELIYDFGQNCAGVVEIKTPDDFDGTIQLNFAEILVDGNFYTDNLRNAKVTDIFTVKGKKILSPEFTYHGFRYMKMTGADLPEENVTALVRHSDMKRTGMICTSNERFQRLYENVIWGQRSNFVDLPTDCPQRDERLGWTGDINAFCCTAAYNYDVRGVIRKWLADVRNDQAETGEIPTVAPDCLNDKLTDAMWCDAITMVPWTMYKMYGDLSYLADNYAAMVKFIAARERNMINGLVAKGHEFGDWLALDVEPLMANGAHGRTDVYFLSNVFHSHSLQLVAKTAELLGDHVNAEMYQEKFQKHLKAVREEYFTETGRLAFDTVTAQTVSLHFDIVPEEHRKRLAETLNENIIRHGYRMVTGFIGTSYLLFVLADHGYWETARRLLLNNAYPGWLYEVDMGATTIWERWNSRMPDGTPDPDGMNSFNHYAYGSVMEFAYRRIAGIDMESVGFGKIKIVPHPLSGLPSFKAEYNSVHGMIRSGYEQKEGKITFTISIPEGVPAVLYIPEHEPIEVVGGDYCFEESWEELACEPYMPESTVTEVFDNPIAVKAFNEVFDDLFVGQEIAWMKNGSQTLQCMAEFCDKEGKMQLCDFPDMLARANLRFCELTQGNTCCEMS